MKRLIAVALAATVAAACSKDPPEVVMVAAEPPPLALPAECTSRDPAWVALPDADVRRDAAARNYAANRRQYSEITGKRAVCRAAITAAKRG